uniref:Uncharacterized protein n=1 Tax=Rhizophora mucronata TaxID=61149 RepID=A0A2P2P358_RHIMU
MNAAFSVAFAYFVSEFYESMLFVCVLLEFLRNIKLNIFGILDLLVLCFCLAFNCKTK